MSFVALYATAAAGGWNVASCCAYVGSVFASQLAGAVWYSPALFGNAWVELAHPKRTLREVQQTQKDYCYESALLGSCVGFLLLRGLLRVVTMEDATEAAAGGRGGGRPVLLLDGAALGVLVSAADGLFGVMHPLFERRPLGLYLLNRGYHAVCFAVAGALMAAYQ